MATPPPLALDAIQPSASIRPGVGGPRDNHPGASLPQPSDAWAGGGTYSGKPANRSPTAAFGLESPTSESSGGLEAYGRPDVEPHAAAGTHHAVFEAAVPRSDAPFSPTGHPHGSPGRDSVVTRDTFPSVAARSTATSQPRSHRGTDGGSASVAAQPDDAEAARVLREVLAKLARVAASDPCGATRQAALAVLSQLGADVVAILPSATRMALQVMDGDKLSKVRHASPGVHPPLPFLTSRAAHTTSQVRMEAARCLGAWGQGTHSVCTALVESLLANHVPRNTAARSLCMLGLPGVASLQGLAQDHCLGVAVQVAALKALTGVPDAIVHSPMAADALAGVLVRCCRDPHALVRATAIEVRRLCS